jgi:23S rRNA pseudouridine2604 synthase
MTRINKYLAENQYASRRESDELIKKGKVLINGKIAKLGDTVSDKDKVEVFGLEKSKKVYYAYYKPKGVVTINAQYAKEKEIKDVTKFPEKVYPIGRLDKDSEGLLIMTNDGTLTDRILNPKHAHEKEYSVELDKPITHQQIGKLHKGVNIGNVGSKKNYITKPALVRRTGSNSFDIVLTEGKNRQIRRMCGALGFSVVKLKRFRILNVNLGNLKPGQFKVINNPLD